MRGVSGAVSVGTFVIALGASATLVLGGPWATRNGNSNQDGHVPVVVDPATFDVSWDWHSPILLGLSVAFHPIAAGDGRVFVSTYITYNSDATSNSMLSALNGATGTLAWPSLSNIWFREPAYANGKLFVTTGLHSSSCSGSNCSERPYLRRFNPATGQQEFAVEYSSQWSHGWGAVPAATGGKIYFNGGYYGGLYEIDEATGAPRFLSLPQQMSWAPAVDDTNVYAYVGGSLNVISRASMTVTRYIDNPDFRGAWPDGVIPLVANGRVFVVAGGTMCCIDPVAAQPIVWSQTLGFEGRAVANNGVVYVYRSGMLNALDAQTGAQLWFWSPGLAENLTSINNMILTDSHLFVQTDHATHAIDLATHQSVWSYAAKGFLALADRRLYIADSSTLTVTAIDLTCPADLDDGSLQGLPDGAVNISDLIYFLDRFEAGNLAADLDDDGDPAARHSDGAVTIDDLLYYLKRFEIGC